MPDRGLKDYMSDQDSVIDVVNQMSREEEEELEAAQEGGLSPLAHNLRSKLTRAESECVELKEKLNMVEQ